MTEDGTAVETELDEKGYQRLETLLDTHCDMNLEMLDGFFAALLAGPRGESPGDYFPLVLGEGKGYETAFPTLEIAKEFIQLALTHWNSVAALLDSSALFAPMLKDELEEADGHDWATGFIKGVKVHSSEWKEFLGDGSNPGPMAPIFALHYQYSKDPEIKFQDEPFSSEQTQQLIAASAAGVMEINKYFSRKKKKVVHENTVKRQGPKVGRNDPCSCGSGKKYKKCCGSK